MSPIDVAGWTLVHFVWQGAILGVLAAVCLRLVSRQTPELRYAIGCLALAAMLAAPAATALTLFDAAGWPLPVIFVAAASHPSEGAAAFVAGSTGSFAGAGGWLASLGGEAALAVVVWAWLAGVAILLTRLGGGWLRVRRLHARLQLAPAASAWRAAAERLSADLGLRALPHVVESALVDVPTVVGWLRPVVVLPVAALACLTPAQVEAILAHELAHVRRHDYLVNLLQAIAETLLFYHPAVWWVSGRIRAEREHCCDDAAVAACGEPESYARALVALESWRASALPAPAATGGLLASRIHRILKLPEEPQPSSATLVVVAALVVATAGGLAARTYPAAGRSSPPAPGVERQGATPPGWSVRATDHFDVYHQQRPEHLARLDRIVREAEVAYELIAATLKHDLGFRAPLFLTDGDLAPLAHLARVRADGNPVVRIVVPLALFETQPRLLVHELTHAFVLDILRPSRMAELPSWLLEGLAEHMAGVWTAGGLAVVRRAIKDGGSVSSQLATSASGAQARHLGHALFDFIRHEFGAEGIRRFLFALRQGGTADGSAVYRAAADLTPAQFDRAFLQYIERNVTLPALEYEVKPQYTPAAMAAGIEGSVLLQAIVLADGTVGEVTVVESLDEEHGLDEQAVEALRQWRFRPGTKDGQPVAVEIAVEMTFTLK
jgi:TonB family protein